MPVNPPVPGCAVSKSKLRTANLLAALSGEIADRLDQRLKSHPNQNDSAAAALNIIGFYGGCSNNALSRALRRSHTATVRLVDKLEADKLVESRAAEDRRSVALHLTDKGRQEARKIVRDRCVALADLIDVLSAGQQAQLAQILEVLLRSLTSDAAEADHICRLCDDSACPAATCPVHQTALASAQ